jgi:diguanylate cyclase (GGDEF)-like protein/PAS domain S-box-containing protein
VPPLVSSWRFLLLGNLLLAAGYACLAKLVMMLLGGHSSVALVWPSSGVALAVLLLGGRRYAPGVFLGAWLACGWTSQNSLWVCLLISLGALLEVLAIHEWLLTRPDFSLKFDRLRHFRLLIQAAIPAAAVAAFIGATSLLLGGALPVQDYGLKLLHWWQGDWLGLLLATPMLLVWRRPPWRRWLRAGGWHVAEFVAFVIFLVLIGQIVYVGWWSETFGLVAQSYWTLLLLIWGATRFGRHGVLLMLLVSAIQGLLGVGLGQGFFAADLERTGLENLWLSFALANCVGVALSLAMHEREGVERALRAEAEFTESIIHSLPGLFYLLDEHGCLIRSNQHLQEDCGCPAERLVGLPVLELVIPEDRGTDAVGIHQAFETGEGQGEGRVQRPDGRLVPYSFYSRRCVLGGETRVLGVAHDVSERKRMEDALRANEQLLKLAIEGSGDAVWDWDVTNRKVTHNSRWNTLLGYDIDEGDAAIGTWQALTHPDDLGIHYANRDALFDGSTQSTAIETRMRCKDGSWKWFLTRGMVVSRDKSGRPARIVGTNADITSFKEHQRQLEHIAHYDALTGMPNRLLLGARLQQAMQDSQRRGTSIAVAYLDLDGFKAVNDQNGHDAGDTLLVQLAQRIKSALRDCDTLARIGGDEFVAVVADLERPEACEVLLERLLVAAAAPVWVAGRELKVSASVGVSFYPRDGDEADLLLRQADQAMYQAKQSGRNRFHLFDSAQDAAVRIRHESVQHIRQALNRHEFELYYQPKVHMRSGKLVGVEALIRWHHPERGLLSPAAFLPLIEEQAIAVELGVWVIEAALGQMERWLDQGLEIAVSVNVGAQHLQQKDFVASLGQFLAAHPRVSPSSLELEVLETSAFEDVARVSEVIRVCQALGVRFALDDFGTGYSSLTYLRRLPAETLKIDQSFVRDMLEDPDDMAIVEGVIGLGNAFHRTLVAEGVETVAQGVALLRLGCEVAQGYAIARPMPAAALVAWLPVWRPDARWSAG